MTFRFAVIADTHVNPTDDGGSSPYASHRLSNERLRHTVSVLNKLNPDFVIHVGDMVHPVPEAISYPKAAAQFHTTMSRLSSPFHLVPGNHDTGDKPADYVPAGVIRSEFIALYEEHFGKHCYSFDARGCHFVVINTSLLNSGLPQEHEQAAWLEQDLAGNEGKRIFLFVHYPPFVATADEQGHYDNIDPPARGWLLDIVDRFGIEAVFTGHVHNFFFNRRGACNYYLIPSTAFVRSDYSEVFTIGQTPQAEGGRNDTAKLGLMIVDVAPGGISASFIRTFDNEGQHGEPVAQHHWPRLHPASGPLPTLGIDMRESWTSLHEIPYSSMLDEFQRKSARNDYRLVALWEMGVRTLRIPLQDLTSEQARERLVAMHSVGTRFIVFCFGFPDAASQLLLHEHRSLFVALEIIVRWPPPVGLADKLREIKSRVDLPIGLSRFWNASGDSRDGKVKLFVDHGFAPNDERLTSLLESADVSVLDRLVFRVGRTASASASIEAAVETAERAAKTAQIHIRLAGENPAIPSDDEQLNTTRVLEAALCSHYYRSHSIILDTLSDVDRGYFCRVGLIDRRSNPRLAGKCLRNLNGALSELPALESLRWIRQAGSTFGLAQSGETSLWLVLPDKQAPSESQSYGEMAVAHGNVSSLDLTTGIEAPAPDLQSALESASCAKTPTLVKLK